MRRAIVVTCLLTAAVFGATVEGTVVNSATGAGVADVTVNLLQEEQVAYTANTDTHGHFQVDGVKDGTYTAIYRVHGFTIFPNQFLRHSEPFLVTGDGPAVHLSAKLPPTGSLSGRVLSPDGAPVSGASVDVTVSGQGVILNQRRPTDAKGEFRFEGLPLSGSWILSAWPPSNWKPPASSDNVRRGWARTYYPGVTDPGAAAHIVIPHTGELWNLEIKLAAAPVYRIRGTVFDLDGRPAPKAQIIMAGGSAFMGAGTKDDGTFEFESAGDGTRLFQVVLAQGGRALRALQNVAINGHDLDDVRLQLTAPFQITGKVVIEVPDGSPRPKLPHIQINNLVGQPDRDGDFSSGNIYPGANSISPGSPPAGFYLDSIRLGKDEAHGRTVDILSGNLPLTITYKRGGGIVRGSVENCEEGDAILVPTDPAIGNPAFVRRGRCDSKGQFEIASVRPGQYYALALPADDFYAGLKDFDSELLQGSTMITVADSQAVTLEIRLIKR
jgi:uncharacterized GH25 family protein